MLFNPTRSRSRNVFALAVISAILSQGSAIAQELNSAQPAPALDKDHQQPTLALNKDHHDHHHDHHHHHDDTNSSFCHGMYMTMFTDGFRWSLLGSSSSKNHHDHHGHHNSTNDGTPPCLAYYVRSWELNGNGKFRGAMVFSFLIALLTEGISASRFVLIDYLHQLMMRHPSISRQRHRKLVLTFVYTIQSLLGTMIMLVAMMYSIEMLLSVVAGLMVGNYLFMREPSNKRRGGATNQHAPTGGGFMAGMGVRHDDSQLASQSISPTSSIARRNPNVVVDEERQGLLASSSGPLVAASDDENSIGGLGSPGGLQMQTRKED